MTAYEQALLWSTVKLLCRDAMEQAQKQDDISLVLSLLVLATDRAIQLKKGLDDAI